MSDDEYYVIRANGVGEQLYRSRPNPLRAVLLFSSAVIAITVLAVPELSKRQDAHVQAQTALDLPSGVDPIVTGSTRQRADLGRPNLRTGIPAIDSAVATERRSTSYVIRRSVLTGSSVCVIGSDGSRRGTC